MNDGNQQNCRIFSMNSKTLGLDGKEAPPSVPSSSGYLPPPLARQSSIYSLTIDEFQNSFGWRGKDFGSMNMDELLKSIWSAEENPTAHESSNALTLQRQGSLTLPGTISQKTVDEVWRDTFKDGPGFPSSSAQIQPKRQPTFGEVTLEEFLLKAGVTWEEPSEPSNAVSEGIFANTSTSGFEAANGLALGFASSSAQRGLSSSFASRGQVGPTTEIVSWQGMRPAGGIVGSTDPAASGGLILGLSDLGSRGEADSPRSKGEGTLSPSSSPMERGPRRRDNGIVEKVVERRQRRMIKNRESAARSRARKQAYTLELEAEIAKLKELNEELMRKQAEILEMQKNQVLEKPTQEPETKKRRMRRTSSWPLTD